MFLSGLRRWWQRKYAPGEWSDERSPWSPSSPFNTQISANPTFLPNSAAIVAAQFPDGLNTQTIRANEAGVYDYNHPRFVAAAACPVQRARDVLGRLGET